MAYFQSQVPKRKKRKRIIDQISNESLEDVLDTVLIILLKNKIIKDIDEFNEILEANKLINTLSDE